jgi:hypothetical protein
MDVVRKRSNDSQYEQSKYQEQNDKRGFQQELIEEVTEDELPKKPYKKGSDRPRPQLCQEAQWFTGELPSPPCQWCIYPGPD